MATIIPSLSSCAGRMQPGERRLAERLEQKLEDDYLIWYDVPVATMQSYPDFVVLHPQRGLLILEVKDWKISTVLRADRGDWQILGSSWKTVEVFRAIDNLTPIRTVFGG
ncbi:nuclease-related domain-containing protein, partial [Pandoraea soli]|uniref:nuclease-related domain-containing protein n=1 Tax=Pandoraea soli TaxID=2508293 RepID=UPI001FE37DD9